MNAAQAAVVLGVLNAAWPTTPITDQTAQLWAEMLEGVDAEDGLTAAKQIVRSSTRFPSIAEFLTTTKPLTAARRRAEAQADWDRKALAAGPEGRRPSREEVRELVRATKEMLSVQKGVEHNHKQYPCPLVRCPWNSNRDAMRLGAYTADSECDGQGGHS